MKEKSPLCQKQTQKKRLKYLKTELISPKPSTRSKILQLSILNTTKTSDLKKKQTNKKIEKECRVIRLMVGGGHKKTRTICYPDTSEYQKLCNLS